MSYADPCSGCEISQGLKSVPGGVIKLPGDWVVNHYGGAEGFLGWLALQPRFHRMALSELTDRELQNLGPNIRSLDRGLSQYWRLRYPSDPVERVYVVYFFESEFESPPMARPYHLHIHIIPRFKSFDTKERLRRTADDTSWVDGWRTPTLSLQRVVPHDYARESAHWHMRAEELVGYLRGELSEWP
jgi:diadenosine tetraphosphate (Ap4A) HIT family hydrolase